MKFSMGIRHKFCWPNVAHIHKVWLLVLRSPCAHEDQRDRDLRLEWNPTHMRTSNDIQTNISCLVSSVPKPLDKQMNRKQMKILLKL